MIAGGDDSLDPAAFAARLGTAWLGRRHVHLHTCNSTNDVAAAEARAGADEGLLVTADAQTGGRGRLGRSWHSPPGVNLYLSIVLRPGRPAAEIPPVTLLAGGAVAEALAALGFAPEVKWPNDVLLAEGAATDMKKVAGILTEAATLGERIDHLAVGIGVNVNGDAFPGELAARATSLRRVAGRPLARAEVLAGLLRSFETAYDRFRAEGPAAAVALWQAHAVLGRRCRARIGERLIEGITIGVGADGALELRDDASAVHRIVAGEVTPA